MSVEPELLVVDDPAAAAAERLIAAAEGPGGQVALSGGSTPRRAYELAARGDWSGASVWFADERCVPPDDPRSNFGMVKEVLLDRLAARPLAVHRIAGEADADEEAARYERLLSTELTSGPIFDLVLLGLGSDGHTGSLFPGRPALEERVRLVAPVPEPGLEPFVARISLTVAALGAGPVLFLITGAGKAQAVARTFGSGERGSTPAAEVVRAAAGPVTVLLDADAASALS